MRWTYPDARPGERIYAIAIARPPGLRGMSWNGDRLVFVSNPPQKVLSTFPPNVQVSLDAAGFIGHVLIECGFVKDLNRGVWVKPNGDEPRARYPALSKCDN